MKRTHGRFGNHRMHVMRLICACCLLSLSICTSAQIANQETFVGRLFWYDPSHDKYVATEFYSASMPDAPKVRIPKKTRIQVVAAQRGWFAIRSGPGSDSASMLYMPIRMFMFRLYQPNLVSDPGAARDAFMRASLFEVDPDLLKSQFEPKDQEATLAATPKPSGKLKPWQKYKENWGSVTPPPKKNKYRLLDDPKQPEQPETPP